MKTYETECIELLEWKISESERIDKEFPWTGGLDGEGTVKRGELFQEFKRRWRILKQKYNIM